MEEDIDVTSHTEVILPLLFQLAGGVFGDSQQANGVKTEQLHLFEWLHHPANLTHTALSFLESQQFPTMTSFSLMGLMVFNFHSAQRTSVCRSCNLGARSGTGGFWHVGWQLTKRFPFSPSCRPWPGVVVAAHREHSL